MSENPSPALGELARLFLRLGATAFGGPAAHIAMMRQEAVVTRRWLSEEEFLDLLGATNLIPGPNSTELAIHIGRLRAGWRGLIVAGACFILPAVFIVSAIAWAYVRYGKLPQVAGLLYGVKPVIIAIVLQALWGLRGAALKSRTLIVLGVLALALSLLGVNELAVLFGSGLLLLVGAWAKREREKRTAALLSVSPVGLLPLFLFFLKVGSVLFGSGYVLLAFMRADLVQRFGWLTPGQLLDAVAVGQITPGPVFTTATFIGYVLAGPPGALVATVGIFMPAFVFVALSAPLLPRLRKSPLASAFLDGVNVAALALMAVVTGQLAQSALRDVPTAVLAILSAFLLLVYRLNSTWLVLGGAVAGLLLKMTLH